MVSGVLKKLIEARSHGCIMRRTRKGGRWEVSRKRDMRLLAVFPSECSFSDVARFKQFLESRSFIRKTPTKFYRLGRIKWDDMQGWALSLDPELKQYWLPAETSWHGIGSSGAGWIEDQTKRMTVERDYENNEELV
jgi:hypothetical protein